MNSWAPINTHWGFENRTVGLRVPLSSPGSKRVENRIPGADTNPYLAIAASLACGYLGIKEEIEPEKPIAGSGFERRHNIPKYLPDAIKRIKVSDSLSEIMGKDFITLFAEVVSKLNGHEMMGRTIKVDLSKPRDRSGGNRNRGGNRGGNDSGKSSRELRALAEEEEDAKKKKRRRPKKD